MKYYVVIHLNKIMLDKRKRKAHRITEKSQYEERQKQMDDDGRVR